MDRNGIKMKYMFINHAIPGSGKSTLSNILAEFIPNTEICSTDDYFMVDGKYVYDPSKVKHYHQLNFKNAIKQMDAGKNVIIDNTNVTKKSYFQYEEEALKRDYQIFHLYFKPDIDLSKKRNIHGVPDNTLVNMARLLSNDFDELMPPNPKNTFWRKIKKFIKNNFLNTGDSK